MKVEKILSERLDTKPFDHLVHSAASPYWPSSDEYSSLDELFTSKTIRIMLVILIKKWIPYWWKSTVRVLRVSGFYTLISLEYYQHKIWVMGSFQCQVKPVFLTDRCDFFPK